MLYVRKAFEKTGPKTLEGFRELSSKSFFKNKSKSNDPCFFVFSLNKLKLKTHVDRLSVKQPDRDSLN